MPVPPPVMRMRLPCSRPSLNMRAPGSGARILRAPGVPESGERDRRRAAERIDNRYTALPQPVTAAWLEDDVLGLVLFRDPDRAFDRAHRAAGAVDHLQRLVGAEPDGPGFHFDAHGALLAFDLLRMHSVHRGLKR